MTSHIVYCETNWLLDLIYQQDADAQSLLEYVMAHPGMVRVPSFCIGEAITSFHARERHHNKLSDSLGAEIVQAIRCEVYNWKELAKHLTQAKLANDRLINDLAERLKTVLPEVQAIVLTIPINAGILKESFELAHRLELTRMDSLVLASILEDVRKVGDCPAGFLSRNTKDFGKELTVERLRGCGIKYFGKTRDALGWAVHGPK